jgi:DinB superfamily
MDSESLKRMLSQDQYFVSANLDGVTPQQTLAELPGGANRINWILGHIVYWRNELLSLAGSPTVWIGPGGEFYRGSPGERRPIVFDERQALPADLLLRDLDTMKTQLEERLSVMGPDDLAAPGGGNRTLGQTIAALLLHEAYHAGQLGVLRRVIGLQGAV